MIDKYLTKVLVCGKTGLVGSAILRKCKELNLDAIGISSRDVDLLDRSATFEYLRKIKPEIVIDAAARAFD